MRITVALIVAAFTLWAAPAAFAAPPPNDARAAAQPVTLPANVQGTTVDATLEEDEPPSCASSGGSVWYRFSVGTARQVLVALDAAGDMDATVEVFARSRSQVQSLGCQPTDKRGEATLDIDATAGTPYLVRVAPLENSVEDRFRLRVVAPDAPASAPGDRLPGGGTTGTLDRFANGDDAWAVQMREGRTYRINLVSTDGCVRGALYAPGNFRGDREKSLDCDDHVVYTPSRSGTYTVLLTAPRGSRARLPYRLRAGLAKRDDSAPGVPLADDHRVRGSLAGNELDALGLYRFTLAQRADLRVRLDAGADFDMRLMTSTGNRLASAEDELVRRLKPGRYYIAVRARDGASGRYTLSRLARTITRANMTVNGGQHPTLAPGQSASLSLHVTPAVNGRATLVVERYDPIEGWLFFATYRTHVAGTAATVAFQPPFVGRWRVTGTYDGTRKSSPSNGGTARFDVLEPLV